MDEQKKRLATILFLLLNVVIWGIFIAPRIGGTVREIFNAGLSSTEGTVQIFEQAESSKELLERIDFASLRDPFEKPGNGAKVSYTATTLKTTVMTTTTSTTVKTDVTTLIPLVERSFTSQFELESIMEINGNYIATLSETEHYGTATSGVPYSYRFGDSGTSTTTENHMVIEGDNIMGETVELIKSDYVIMSEDGLYYKLTFSGGYSVDSVE